MIGREYRETIDISVSSISHVRQQRDRMQASNSGYIPYDNRGTKVQGCNFGDIPGLDCCICGQLFYGIMYKIHPIKPRIWFRHHCLIPSFMIGSVLAVGNGTDAAYIFSIGLCHRRQLAGFGVSMARAIRDCDRLRIEDGIRLADGRG